MLKSYQLVAISACRTDEDRKLMIEMLFNEKEFDLKNDFKNFSNSVNPFLHAMTGAHNAHIVGSLPADERQKDSIKLVEHLYVYSTYVRPGKHSVFIYNPEDGSLYRKIIAVDVQKDGFIPRRNSEDEKVL